VRSTVAGRPSGRLPRAAEAALLLGGTLFVLPGTAAAFHTDEQRITDESAYTLQQGQWRVGLWKVQYGLFEPILLGTYHLPWLLSVSNLHVKARLWQGPEWAFSVFTGFFHFDTRSLRDLDPEAGQAKITAVPFELAASYRANDALTWTFAPVWTTVAVEGSLGQDAFRGAAGGAVDNIQMTGTLEWRLSHVTALLFHARYLVAQTARARGDLVLHPDEFTTIEVHLTSRTDALDFQRAASITVSGVWSWETFNLRTGLAFGHYNVPGVNFVLGQGTVVPELDVYWIF
jgi:hypothetical protein